MDWWIQLPKQRQKITLRKVWVCYFFSAVYHSKNYLIPNSAIAAILSIVLNILKRRKQQLCKSNSPNATTVDNYRKIVINCDQIEFYFKMATILDTMLNIWTFWTKPIFNFNRLNWPLNSHKKLKSNAFYRVYLPDRSLEHYWRSSWTPSWTLFLIFEPWESNQFSFLILCII